MEPYEEMYYKLFNKITDMISEMQAVQQETEELFISASEHKFADWHKSTVLPMAIHNVADEK